MGHFLMETFALRIVKVHQLQVIKDTLLSRRYEEKPFRTGLSTSVSRPS